LHCGWHSPSPRLFQLQPSAHAWFAFGSETSYATMWYFDASNPVTDT